MRSIYTHSMALLAAVGLGLAGAGASHAQTFSMTESSPTANVNDVVTFTVMLNPATGGSTGLFGYDANIFFSSTYLSVGTSPYTPSAASLAAFPEKEVTNNTVTQSGGVTDLRITYANANSDAAISAPTALGSFSATVLAPLPAGGTTISFGPNSTDINNSAGSGFSELLSFDPNTGAITELLQGVSGATLSPPAAAPEPSGLLALASGATGLGLMAWRKRRAA